MKNLPCMLLLLALTACASMSGGGEERYWLKSGSVGRVDDATSLLLYANYVRVLSSADHDRELERQRSAFARDKSDFRRLQYALVLALPEAGFADRRNAQQLLEPVLDGKHDAGLVALANLLNGQLSAQALAANTQRRVDELEKKLDAVKDIERSLMRREKGKS